MSTRETILKELKIKGKARADELSEPLNLTAMAVRQHLYQLQEEGAVECISVASGRGRPAKYWRLTEKSNVYFQDAHRDLSLDLISGIRDVLGGDALLQLLDHRSTKQEKTYKEAMAEADDLSEKLVALAKARSSEGYMADVTTEDGDLLFIENHCPICEAAKSCSGICSQELQLFQKLFEDEAFVERSEHIVAGARRCAYKVSKKN
ncbi:transcriptional regulator [Kordiimonas sp. SCSIO 12603]|uniref:helix-turn-helix transcriptional regulator n=1 Tax=Kordiimonas sp. SCSIO 12603 TaxID=2829596 RepID=UPI002103836B|nr:metalloregulator ArsR/SmtB family transcription factor [Kordiimonas sp. SCSIO 12603]UTW57540.1 transcriptional regulator [Kordiimonas sp. SCSIO 12603]